jgi:hypothetical protein
MNAATLVLPGAGLVMVGALLTLPPAKRAAGTAAALSSGAVAAVLAYSEAGWMLGPTTWLGSIALAVGALAVVLRFEPIRSDRDGEEVR